MNTIGTLATILPLLFLVFRSLWLVVVGALPTTLSLAIVLGILGFIGTRLSAAGTGVSAMLFGLGIDGVVLLYVAHLLPNTSTHATDTASRISGPATSMLLGMWTTAATFYGLMFVDFPSLQQLGSASRSQHGDLRRVDAAARASAVAARSAAQAAPRVGTSQADRMDCGEPPDVSWSQRWC